MKLYKYMRALDDTICSKKESCKEYRGVMISERLRKMLAYSRIYLSNPEVFNDPFDGYFSIQFESEQDKDDAKKIIERKAEQFVKEGKITKKRADRIKDSLFTQISLENFRVACFSEDDKNDLMWAHYADQHRGVCLVYEIDDKRAAFTVENNCCVFVENDVDDTECYGCFGGGGVKLLLERINYRKNKEFLKISLGKVVDEYNTEWPMYTKSTVWEYEHEIRLVAKLPFGCAFSDDTYFCKINKSSLKEVRFGIRLEKKYQQQLQEIIKRSGYMNVVFKQAVVNTNNFSIDFKNIN